MKQEFVTEESDVGRRLDSWLSARAGISRSEVERLVEGGCVIVGGRPATKAHRLRAGEVVEIEELSSTSSHVPRRPEVTVKFEDEHIAVVSKPAGVVVHGAAPSLVDALASRMDLAAAGGDERPGIIHRLDKYTSGLMVVAKTDRAFDALTLQMKARTISRAYVALVAGAFTMTTGRIEAPVGRSVATPTRMKISDTGREAITEFRVLESFSSSTLVEVVLVTGRTHQIRVHFAHIKHPVVGDEVYGPSTSSFAAKLGLERPFLHAVRLAFGHPFEDREVKIEDDLAPDLTAALARVREDG